MDGLDPIRPSEKLPRNAASPRPPSGSTAQHVEGHRQQIRRRTRNPLRHASAQPLGVFAPANLPPSITARLNAALVKVLATPELKREFEKGGYEAASSTPSEFAAMVRDAYERWGRIAATLGVQKE